MVHTMSIEDIEKFDPCFHDYCRVKKLLPRRQKVSAERARKLGCLYKDITWVATLVAKGDEGLAHRLTSFVNDNTKVSLPVFEKQCVGDSRPRKEIEACNKFLSGQISEGEWGEATRLIWDGGSEGCWPARIVKDYWGVVNASELKPIADNPLYCKSIPVRKAIKGQDIPPAVFREWQFDRLIYWLTEKKPQPLPMPKQLQQER